MARTKPPGASTPGRAAAIKIARPCSRQTRRPRIRRARGDHLARTKSRRLEQRRSPEQSAGPLPRFRDRGRQRHRRSAAQARARNPGDRPRARTAAQMAECPQLLAHDGARVARSQRPHRRVLATMARPARRRWSCNRATSRAPRTCSSGAIFSALANPVAARRAGRSCIRSPRCAAHATFVARWLVDRNSPTTAPVGESRLAGLLRHGPVSTSEDFGTQSDPPSASRSCSIGWPASSWTAAGA